MYFLSHPIILNSQIIKRLITQNSLLIWTVYPNCSLKFLTTKLSFDFPYPSNTWLVSLSRQLSSSHLKSKMINNNETRSRLVINKEQKSLQLSTSAGKLCRKRIKRKVKQNSIDLLIISIRLKLGTNSQATFFFKKVGDQ